MNGISVKDILTRETVWGPHHLAHTVSHVKVSFTVIPLITAAGDVYFAQFIFRVGFTLISQLLRVINGKITKQAAQSGLAKAMAVAAAPIAQQAAANNHAISGSSRSCGISMSRLSLFPPA
jgi:hypothetical protein